MKGIIFQVVRQAVEEQFGQETWEDLLEEAGLDGVFAATGDYEDAALEALVAAAAAKLKLTREELLVTLGQLVMPHLANAYPTLVQKHTTLRSFLMSIHGVIHVEVVRLYRDAKPPKFTYEDGPDGALDMLYESDRNLSALAEGFIRGAAPMFQENIEVTRTPEGERMRIRIANLAP